MDSKVTPSPLSEDEALEHPEVKDAQAYCDELATYVSLRLHDAMDNLVMQAEEKLYLLLNRIPLKDPDALAKMICSETCDRLSSLAPSIREVKAEIMKALRGHIDNVQTCNLCLNVDGKIERK